MARNSGHEESTALRVERDPAVLVLMDHCRQMKRQECRLRTATALLLLAGAALLVVLSIRGCAHTATQKDPVRPPAAQHDARKGQNLDLSAMPTAKPTAHLTASSETLDPHIIHWQHQEDLQGFQYNEGDLIVPQEGTYHVYLQVTYRKPESYNCSKGDQFIPLRPMVKKWHDSYPEHMPFMSASDYLPCNEIYEKSIYTAGTYVLEKNSKLRVWYGTKKELAVHTDEHKIFFGAYLV